MYLIEIFIFAFLGLILGSFSTALIHRIPRKLPWGKERSTCVKCNKNLGVLDLVPVISWCIFKGKCRHCSSKISYKYPIIEIISLLLCLAIYFTFGVSIESLFFIISLPILLSLLVIDLEHMILPNQLTLILFVIGIIRVIYNLIIGAEWLDYIGGAVIYLLFAWGLGALSSKILKKEALGFGDVKFFGVVGIWLGASMLSYFLILSGGIAVLFALCWRAIKKTELFPFGPALIIAFYALLLIQGSFFT